MVTYVAGLVVSVGRWERPISTLPRPAGHAIRSGRGNRRLRTRSETKQKMSAFDVSFYPLRSPRI
jgi:hypothetical protein